MLGHAVVVVGDDRPAVAESAEVLGGVEGDRGGDAPSAPARPAVQGRPPMAWAASSSTGRPSARSLRRGRAPGSRTDRRRRSRVVRGVRGRPGPYRPSQFRVSPVRRHAEHRASAGGDDRLGTRVEDREGRNARPRRRARLRARAVADRVMASVPFATPTTWATPRYEANSRSNALTSGPSTNTPESSTALTRSRIASLKGRQRCHGVK